MTIALMDVGVGFADRAAVNVYLIDVYKKMIKTTCFGHYWQSSGFLSERTVCCKIVYIRYAAAYRCSDLIIEDFELNMVYRLGMEPSDVGSKQVGGGGGSLVTAHITRLHTQAIYHV